eukprot:8090955-Alexandrium_andersonii.AAC.1
MKIPNRAIKFPSAEGKQPSTGRIKQGWCQGVGQNAHRNCGCTPPGHEHAAESVDFNINARGLGG